MIYPILNDKIIMEKKQPLYSDIYIDLGETMYPISVNKTGAQILRLCNGMNSIDEIIEQISMLYNEKKEECEIKIRNFIDLSCKYGYVFLKEVIENRKPIVIKGNDEYWSLDAVCIELTHKCPLCCKHCYVNAGEGNNIDTNKVLDIIEQCTDMGTTIIQLTGGEPLIHPDFFEFLEAAIKNNLEISIFTSGYICDEDILSRLNKYKNYKKISFQVSLDGLDKSHNLLRGKADSFKNAISFIKIVKMIGIKVYVGTCIESQSYNEILQLGHIIKRLGVSVFRISPISSVGRAKENRIINDVSKVKYVKEVTKKIKQELEDDNFKVLYFEEGELNINYKYKKNCGLGQTVLKIDPNGKVYPCLLSNITYADINFMSLSDIQKKYSRIWEKVICPNSSSCSQCEKLMLCNHCVCEGIENCVKKDSFFYAEYMNLLEKI